MRNQFTAVIERDANWFIAYCLNITKSLAYHGFKKILLVNGHGSNTPLIDLVARKTVLGTDSLCAAVNYFALSMDAFARVRESPVMAHADEYETSMYLYMAQDRVRVQEIQDGSDVVGKFLSSDSTSNYPVRFNDFWGRWTKLGVHGDPTTATADKGQVIFEAAVSGLVEIVDELREWPIAERSDQHRDQPVATAPTAELKRPRFEQA